MKRQVMVVSGVFGLVLMMLLACVQVAPIEMVDTVPEAAEVVEPEMQTGSDFLAANPELMAARRYNDAVVIKAVSGSKYYSANPELMVVNRFVAPTVRDKVMFGSTYLAANPELMAARRFSAVAETEVDKTVTHETPEKWNDVVNRPDYCWPGCKPGH